MRSIKILFKELLWPGVAFLLLMLPALALWTILFLVLNLLIQ
jgi:hypothetical protein